jgi:organic radical activating enzyme
MQTNLEIDVGDMTFADGVLPRLIAVLRESRDGESFSVVSGDPRVRADLEAWCRFTRNSLISTTPHAGRFRHIVRRGVAPAEPEADRTIGARLWLYTNFDCNLQCAYCCVRSSPKAPRRPLGLPRIRQIANEARGLAVKDIFVTGGEPFVLPDIDDIVTACAEAAPTTVLTNGMLFSGRRLASLRALPRERVTLQISVDSPTPERHDRNRGRGAWARALKGVDIARGEGFRVRLAATVADQTEADEFRAFLDAEGVAERDRIIRRVALRGFAEDGLALARGDLAPEVTITADGVYWHPIGAEDADLLVRREIFPLVEAFVAVREAYDRESDHARRLAQIFNCA